MPEAITPDINAKGPTAQGVVDNDELWKGLADQEVKQAEEDSKGILSDPSRPEGKGDATKEQEPQFREADFEKVVGFYQDDKGAWHRPDGKFANAEEGMLADAAITAQESGEEVPEGDDKSTPETNAEQKKNKQASAKANADDGVADGEQGATEEIHDWQPVETPVVKYEVKVGDGTPAKDIPDMTFKFKANGKDVEYDLPKVVRLAQMGVYNEERELQVQQTKGREAQWNNQLQAYQQELMGWKQWFERVMDPTQDAFIIGARQEYARINTPEARALRDEQARIAQANQQLAQRQHQQSVDYVNNRITPAMIKIAQENPKITEEEMHGKFAMLTAPLLVNGQMPPDRLYDVMRIVEQDLSHWAEGISQIREQTEQEKEAKTRTIVSRQKAETARTKRQMARVINSGASRALPDQGSGTQPPPKPKSVDDFMSQMFGQGG